MASHPYSIRHRPCKSASHCGWIERRSTERRFDADTPVRVLGAVLCASAKPTASVFAQCGIWMALALRVLPISCKKTDSGPAKSIARRPLLMLSTVLSRALVCASFALVSTAVVAKESQPVLSCETAQVERATLKQAPKGTRRVETHVLEVMTKKGPQRFVDKPPHDVGDMGGVHWRYCGYDAQAKAHLIEMTDESSYSGDLLLDETGKLVHAGHTVLFSPNGKEFLAIEQEAGVDGEEWAVYDMTGKTMWKGSAGTVAKVDGFDTVVSTFERPQWTKQGELTARFICAFSKVHGVVTLVRSSSGTLSWRGHGKCS